MLYLKKQKQNKKISAQRGSIIILTIVFTSIFIGIMGGVFSLFIYQNRLAKKLQAKEVAVQIAEAGINYYRWHLAHAEEDYTDGDDEEVCVYPAVCGPYRHDYNDPLGGKIGEFKLYITPPPVGSTIVTIKSTGWVDDFANQSRTIEVKYGIPSLATYSFLTNSNAWFFETESVVGPLHANGGIRMDGTNNSIVSSNKTAYICDWFNGCSPNQNKPGIWGTGPGDDLWQFPAPLIDFATISLELAQMRIDSQTPSGVHYSDSGAEGYRVVFKNDGTFDVWRVNTLVQQPTTYINIEGSGWQYGFAEQPNNQTFLGNRSAPANGIIFMEDNIWVEGIVKGRFTLVSAKLTGIPADYTTIRINNNLTYLSRNGTNTLGLIAEKDIRVPRYAPNILTIDAILLAQNGIVRRSEYYPRTLQTSIETYGGIITNGQWTWSYGTVYTVVEGYVTTISIYDNNMLFSPPPSFPNTGEYTFISWEEKIAGEP